MMHHYFVSYTQFKNDNMQYGSMAIEIPEKYKASDVDILIKALIKTLEVDKVHIQSINYLGEFEEE